jgi:tetratricopeptide (TPR) repeat protein
MGQRILMVVGTAVLLVLGLFFLTQWSRQYNWSKDASGAGEKAVAEQSGGGSGATSSATPDGPGTSPDGMPSPQAAAASGPDDLETLVAELGGPVEGGVASKIDSLRAAVEEADGTERRQLQAQLAQLYVGAGTPGRAALVQSRLADRSGDVADRRRAADLLYKWMRQVQQRSERARVADVARHVADTYAAVVEERPEDLDARTRMGEAYLLTNNPMKGIQAINQVLDDDSTFEQARFQKGLALLQIDRLDQAVTQFETVMEVASEDDPFYQQAKRAIDVIRKETSSSNGERSGRSGPR